MLNEELMVDECYICQEACEEKSPCECKAHVHAKCLENFCSISNNNSCTICQSVFAGTVERSDETTVQLSLQRRIVIGLLFYFVMGVLGHTLVQMYSGTETTFEYAFWTGTFLTTSLVTSIIICMISGCLFMVRWAIFEILTHVTNMFNNTI